MIRNIQNGKELSRELQEQMAQVKTLIERRLPQQIADKAQQQVDNSFMNEQFQDKKSSKWKGREKDKESGKARIERRGILVGEGTGKLIHSVEAEVRSIDTVAISITNPLVLDYAAVHNEGLRSGRGKGFMMPQRQFMPIPGEANPALEKEIEKYLDTEMDKIFL